MPSFQQRKEILISLAGSLNCDVDFDKIAQITPGFVAHDISLLFQEALNNNKKLEVLEVSYTFYIFMNVIVNIHNLIY